MQNRRMQRALSGLKTLTRRHCSLRSIINIANFIHHLRAPPAPSPPFLLPPSSSPCLMCANLGTHHTESSLDTALEWAEEILLKERKRDVVLLSEQRQVSNRVRSSPSRPTSSLSRTPSAPDGTRGISRFSLQDAGSRLTLRSDDSSVVLPYKPVGLDPISKAEGGTSLGIEGVADGMEAGASRGDECELPSVLPAEATAFLGEHEEYYARAGMLRMSSFDSREGRGSCELMRGRGRGNLQGYRFD